MTAVSAKVVHDALLHLRDATALASHPITGARVVRRLLAAASGDGQAIATFLTGVIEANLTDRRGAAPPADTGDHPTARVWLERDFAAGDKAREAWSCLYHRYVAAPPWAVEALAAVARPGYDYADRHIRRRLTRGYALLADVLRELDLADASVSGAQAAGGERPPGRVVNVPAPITRLFGRERELAQVARSLRAGRLSTLVGPAGVGKTRIAQQVSLALPPGVVDYGWWIDLAGLGRGADLTRALVRQIAGDDLTGRSDAVLRTALTGTRSLLVVDNCEHLLPDVAEFLARQLHTFPGLVVLATSREPLSVSGEQVLKVQPLSVPDAEERHLAAIETHDSTRLFVDRLRLAQPDLHLGSDGFAQVATVCRCFDGLPLALELVAARGWHLSLPEIAARASERLDLAGGPWHGVTRHHLSLRAALEWNIDLLGEEEQVAFRRMGILRGAFDAHDLAEIIAGEPLLPERIPHVLESLERRSLVVADPVDGTTRYHLLQVVRDYANELLRDPGERLACEERRLLSCSAAAERLATRFARTGDPASIARMDALFPDIVAALDHALAHPASAVSGLRLAVAVSAYKRHTGGAERGYRDVAALRASAGHDVPPALAADVELAMSHLARARGDLASAERHARAGLAADEALGRIEQANEATYVLSQIAYARADLDGAVGLLAPGLRWARAHDPLHLARVSHALFLIAMRRRDAESARAILREGLAAAVASGHLHLPIALRAGLGEVAELEEDLATAETCFREILDAARTAGFSRFEVHATMKLGTLARKTGRLEDAEEWLTRAADLAVRLAVPGVVSAVRYELAEVARAAGEPERAAELLATAVVGSDDVLRVDILRSAAAMLAARGLVVDAARLVGGADALASAVGVPETELERVAWANLARDIARASGAAAFEEAVRTGAELDPADLIAAGVARLRVP